MSELELLSSLEHPRSSGLSAIPEVMSIHEQSTPSSWSMRLSIEEEATKCVLLNEIIHGVHADQVVGWLYTCFYASTVFI
jgi:hypothetical protein